MASGPSITGLSINAFGNAVPQNQPSFTVAALNAATPNPNEVTAAAQARSAGAQLRLPSDTPPYWVSLGIANYQRDSWRTVGTLTTPTNIVLPLPTDIVFNQDVKYDDKKEIGAAGYAALNGYGTGKALLAGRTPPSSLGDAAAGAAGLGGQAILNYINGLGGATPNAVTGAQIAAGVAVNNFATLMLEGPTYRHFELTFILSPRTQAETDTLSQMFRIINNAQAPGLVPGLGAAFFTYPSLFQIAYNGPTNMGVRLHRFKPAFLESSVWNFNPEHPPAFYRTTSGPETVKVSLKFIEAEYWLTGDFT